MIYVHDTHKLQIAREAAGLTIQQLARLAGVSHTVIYNIESGKKAEVQQKTRHDVAALLAKALHLQVNDIFDPIELTHLGRAAETGTPYSRGVVRAKAICPQCRLQVPATGICDSHGDIRLLA